MSIRVYSHGKEIKGMRTIRLGKTGLKVSKMGRGGIPIQRPPLEEAVRVINHALDLGINLIDTSIGYGDSEIIIGKDIADGRDEVILATKGSWRDKATAKEHVDSSLKRLNTDYIGIQPRHHQTITVLTDVSDNRVQGKTHVLLGIKKLRRSLN